MQADAEEVVSEEKERNSFEEKYFTIFRIKDWDVDWRQSYADAYG